MFFGREEELKVLTKENWRASGELIVVYGRRRVGKTALIEHAFQEKDVWKFEGIEGEHLATQLVVALQNLNRYSNQRYEPDQCTSWPEFLALLHTEIEHRKENPPIIFFDEFQWLAEMKGSLVSLLKSWWDNQFSRYSNLKLILCGSVSSFMVRKVLRSKALYGRITQEIWLKPLGLVDIRKFFTPSRTDREIIEIAMCFGGVPKYLEELNPELSLIQNLNTLAFQPQGYFFREFQRVFISHFGQNKQYETVVKALSKHSCTTSELAERCEVKSGGTFSLVLEDLVLAGFIERYTPLTLASENSRSVRYRLVDEYLQLYFNLIVPHRKEIESGSLQGSDILSTRHYQQWCGYAFEKLCLRNSRQIATALQFAGIRYKSGSWFTVRGDQGHGMQIDLLFERADSMITLCELKYSRTLDASKIIASVERNTTLLESKYKRYGIQKVLIVGNQPSISAKLSQYFDKILTAEELFCRV